MAASQACWGIDLGRAALKAVKLRPGADGKVEVVAIDHVEHAKILSQPDADRQELISSALEAFLSRNDLSKDQVVISVPGQQTLARFSKLPPVSPKRIPDIVRYEADQQIPFDMDDVIWDYQTFQEEGAPDIEVGIFAMKRELIREHLLHFEQASIEPIAVQAGPLAAYNAAHFDSALSKETTIILDIGAESTDLIIATPTRLWTRTVPIGGNSFTDALVQSFKIAFSKAEGLKRSAATNKHAPQIFRAMRPIFADLEQELSRSIGFYSSTHRDAKVDKVIGVGNAFQLPGLQKYLQQNLSLPVERPESFTNATIAEGVNTETLKEQFSSFYVAYGLALQGLGLTQVTSNLLPAEIAKQIVWRKKRPAFAASAACIVLAGALIWFRQSADMAAFAGPVSAEKISGPKALAILETGPTGASSDRERASLILAAGNAANTALKALSGKGDTERKEAERLIVVQQNRKLIPQLYRILHDALPNPREPLPIESEALIAAIQSTPRGERRTVNVESLMMDYVVDLNNPIWKESLAKAPKPINDFSQTIPGVLIKIACTTPNQNGAKFIDEQYVSKIRDLGRQPGAGFYFDRVWLMKGEKVGARASGGGPKTTKGVSSAPKSSSTGPILDLLTAEARDQDWWFEIWVDVILKDLDPKNVGESSGAGEKTKEGGG